MNEGNARIEAPRSIEKTYNIMDESYLERCIRALPPEKQSAARAAFRDIAADGDDSVFSKVLVTLEATSAYAERIPTEMVRSGEALLRELDERMARSARAQAEADAQREKLLREVIAAQVPQLGKALALDKVNALLTAQTTELGRIERSLERLRQVRVGGLLLVLGLGALLGSGAMAGVFWHRYAQAQRAQRFIARMESLGIDAEITPSGADVRFTIKCPYAITGTGWRKDGQGYIAGADFIVATGGDR